MADALCGPSNALQNIQKHSTVDRTLQQDRLINKPLPSQGFRSSPGPNAGLLDPEFEAFQAGQIPLPHPEAQQFHPLGAPITHTPPQLNQPALATWAVDFQQLGISSPTPQSQLRQLGNSWENEFVKQQSQPVSLAPSNYIDYNTNPFQRLSTIAPMVPPQSQIHSAAVAQQGLLGQSQAPNMETFDEEAFVRAFDQAALSELEMERGLAPQESLGVDHGVLVNESAEKQMDSDQEMERQRLGADLIDDPRISVEGMKTQGKQDALARTAGQLLDTVKNNKSDKFQKSQFLQLMRQLRDREVTVEGDQFVGVQPQDRDDALEKSLLSIARQLSQLDFGRVEPLITPRVIKSSTFRPVADQLVMGAFVRTLMQVSAALEKLMAVYPDLIQRSKPFGMSIGVEVFALADNPLIEPYPALQTLVLSFKRQFSELGIDAGMLRRCTNEEPLRSSSSSTTTTTTTTTTTHASNSSSGEAQLRAWLSDWIATTTTSARRRRWSRGAITDANANANAEAEWLLSRDQISALLGPNLYPPKTQSPPTQHHLDRITDILGPHLMSAMLAVRDSSHSAVFANAPVTCLEDLAAYAAAARQWRVVGDGGDGSGDGDDDDVVPAPALRDVFPPPPSPPAAAASYEDMLLGLLEEVEVRAERWRGAARRRGIRKDDDDEGD